MGPPAGEATISATTMPGRRHQQGTAWTRLTSSIQPSVPGVRGHDLHAADGVIVDALSPWPALTGLALRPMTGLPGYTRRASSSQRIPRGRIQLIRLRPARQADPDQAARALSSLPSHRPAPGERALPGAAAQRTASRSSKSLGNTAPCGSRRTKPPHHVPPRTATCRRRPPHAGPGAQLFTTCSRQRGGIRLPGGRFGRGSGGRAHLPRGGSRGVMRGRGRRAAAGRRPGRPAAACQSGTSAPATRSTRSLRRTTTEARMTPTRVASPRTRASRRVSSARRRGVE